MRRVGISVTLLAVLGATTLIAGCSSSANSSGDGDSITVWSLEEQPDRLAKAKADAADFTTKTGIKVKLVGINEDQFPQLLTAAAAAGTMPDVIGALPLNDVRTMSSNDLVDTKTATQIVKDLGPDTFSKSALDLTRDGSTQLAVPSDGFALSVIYRKDLFAKAGLPAPKTYADLLNAAQKLNSPQIAGFVGGTSPSTAFTQQLFEWAALANGCQLVDGSGKVTIDSKQCVDAFNFYGNLIKNYSVPGSLDSTAVKTTYMAGKAAITIWASFILPEMAGQDKDIMPTCPQCKTDPSFIAKNSGFVTSFQGPDGSSPVQGGDVTSWVVTSTAKTSAATKFVEYFMNDGYLPWLNQAPEGKFPTRHGTSDDPQKFITGWSKLSTGIDTKAPLSTYYTQDEITAWQKSVDSFSRWAFTEGQGNLMGAILTQLPVPKAINALDNGDVDGAGAAAQAQKAVKSIQSSTK
ncbi:ABC transporter substrate-binding protein [Rugosimonospora africana]|uniref:Bicyclomycin resistance protein n=1 Tax=Rugosimonospora africana TaxID=556532 RepID=A0A8J3QTP0_9ACTN|nr:extracellular solute-binding protein [Rugosimonospora africana]GIH16638.1 bicyclomycin resistance protein [Rugosimonospora africana]